MVGAEIEQLLNRLSTKNLEYDIEFCTCFEVYDARHDTLQPGCRFPVAFPQSR